MLPAHAGMRLDTTSSEKGRKRADGKLSDLRICQPHAAYTRSRSFIFVMRYRSDCTAFVPQAGCTQKSLVAVCAATRLSVKLRWARPS